MCELQKGLKTCENVLNQQLSDLKNILLLVAKSRYREDLNL
jgi:hypothetical protein